ncbi:MAG: glycosyltransferase [Pseudomonadota bacterium]
MKFSVITPSFNQAQFLPDNLRTVSGQTGVVLEHIIVDPGSTDGSTDIARAADHAILINEPDRGQSHGITKGFERATGDVLCWLNSDDMFPTSDTLSKVAAAFARNPDADIVYGGVDFVGEDGAFLRKGFVNKASDTLLASFHEQVGIVQPGVFWRRKVFDTLGGPSEDYNYCMDYEYWVRMADAGFKWVHVDDTFAHHRWWSGMKTSAGRDKSLIEHFKVNARYFGYIHWKWIDRYAEYMATRADGVVNHAAEADQQEKQKHAQQAIAQFVTQDMLQLLRRSTEKNHVETLAYYQQNAPDLTPFLFSRDELPADVVMDHPDPLAQERPAWCIFNTHSPSTGQRFLTYSVPENFDRHVTASWYAEEHARAIARMKRLQDNRKDVCVIVANGPSLNKTNFDLLPRADVMVSNFAIINEKLRCAATYLTVVNDLVAVQGSIEFNQVTAHKLVPFWLSNAINPSPNTCFLPATVKPDFNFDLDGTYSWRSTVSYFNMQLAHVLGYETVLLVGFDHSYQQAVERKEGDAIDQKDEDPNHFDPRYFKGKVWQAADTDNMEKSYVHARDAYARTNRRIFNATVGGKLEVFPRVALEDYLPSGDPTTARLSPGKTGSDLPRVLMFDMTAMGNGTATGEIKSTLFGAWRAEDILQVSAPRPGSMALVRATGPETFVEDAAQPAQIREAIDRFAPDVVLYRPVADRPDLHGFAMTQIDRLGVPLVTWIMDDWPERLRAQDAEAFAAMDRDLRALLDRSARCLSISEAMSAAFGQRYGVSFHSVANGVDPADWPGARPHAGAGLVVRYAGGLAPDMNGAAVARVARAVEARAAAGQDIRFEINTQSHWIDVSGHLFDGLTATTLTAVKRSTAEYRAWLAGADVLLIAYNDDAASLRYVRYSMANKLPECLASGAALLVHGPRGVATVDTVAARGLGQIVADTDPAALKAALADLADADLRSDLSAAAWAAVHSHYDRSKIARGLEDILRTASKAKTETGADAAALQAAQDRIAALERQLDGFRGARDQLDQSTAALTTLQGKQGVLEDEIAHARRETANRDDRLAQMRASLDEMVQLTDTQARERDDLAARLEAERQRAEEAQAHVDALLATRSWRITAPLRRIALRLRR